MSDAFVPEADRLDQERDVGPPAVEPDDERPGARPQPQSPRLPLEAPEADFLEQYQEVAEDEYE